MSVRSSPTVTVTFDAPGRRARTVTRPSWTCAPSRECGSWCKPLTSWSSSSLPTGRGPVGLDAAAFGAAAFFATALVGAALAGAAFLAGLSLTSSPHQPLDRAERYREPGRSVAGLIDDLIDGLVELHRPQQRRVLPWITTARTGIAVTEGVSVSFCPFVRAVRETRAAGLFGEQMLRCVVERPQHASNVTQRAHQRGALGQRPSRFAFEVDDLPPVLHAQRLAEVEVAVDPLHRDLRRQGGNRVVRRAEPVGE